MKDDFKMFFCDTFMNKLLNCIKVYSKQQLLVVD